MISYSAEQKIGPVVPDIWFLSFCIFDPAGSGDGLTFLPCLTFLISSPLYDLNSGHLQISFYVEPSSSLGMSVLRIGRPPLLVSKICKIYTGSVGDLLRFVLGRIESLIVSISLRYELALLMPWTAKDSQDIGRKM
jgi:hypothetical protein